MGRKPTNEPPRKRGRPRKNVFDMEDYDLSTPEARQKLLNDTVNYALKGIITSGTATSISKLVKGYEDGISIVENEKELAYLKYLVAQIISRKTDTSIEDVINIMETYSPKFDNDEGE